MPWASWNELIPEILGGSKPSGKNDSCEVARLQIGEGSHFPPSNPRGLNEAVSLRSTGLPVHVVYLVEERFVGGEENCERIRIIFR